jgi:hypothetical protein
MSTLGSIAGQLVVQMVANGYIARPRAKGEILALVIAGLSGIAFLIFGIIAGYRWLATTYGPDMAPALAAGGAFLFFVAACVAASVQARRRRRFVNNVEDKIAQALKDFSATAEKDVEKMAGDNPKAAIALASLAGFLLARRLL